MSILYTRTHPLAIVWIVDNVEFRGRSGWQVLGGMWSCFMCRGALREEPIAGSPNLVRSRSASSVLPPSDCVLQFLGMNKTLSQREVPPHMRKEQLKKQVRGWLPYLPHPF